MEPFFAIAGLVMVAAITPGPNNFVVLSAAARGGLGAALPAIAGVIAGSIGLLFVVSAGAGLAFAAEPRLRTALVLAGCLYLIWLGAALIWRSDRSNDNKPSSASTLPAGFIGLSAFQLLNPKSWLLVMTATAAAPAGMSWHASLATLALIFMAVTSVCLSLWALAGSVLAEFLKHPRPRRRFDRVMGAVLIVSAALLVL